MKIFLLVFVLPITLVAQTFKIEEINDWGKQAKRVTIIRDNWGVPHIYGKKDADAVFGLMYSQCEDNYWQFEETFITNLGRKAELLGDKGLENDWAISVYQIRSKGKRSYEAAEPLIKQLCNSAASGINYFLYKHPNVERRLIQRYEPWYFLLPEIRDPSTHGVTKQETFNLLKNIITKESEGIEVDHWVQEMESGSNAIAIAPVKSTSGNSMLLINPHVGFFGNGQRYECHLNSEEGMNVSGFAMLGDFWMWSGFNENIGWAHTNSGADFVDVYLEKFDHPTDSLLYRYGDKYKKAVLFTDTLAYRSGSLLKKKIFRFVTTDHGPVVAKRDSMYITVKSSTGSPLMYINQCWRIMRAKNLKEFQEALNLRAFGYPNTMYADRLGNIAYWHGNAVPKRSTKYNWQYPVDGSNPETDWHELHPLSEIVHSINPNSGWLQNCNSTPFLCAGSNSPDSALYPKYMAYDHQIFRADEAINLLINSKKISFEQFQNLVVSTHLPMMEYWLPQIIKAYDRGVIKDAHTREKLKVVMDTLRHWNCNSEIKSTGAAVSAVWLNIAANWARKQIRPSDAISGAMDKYVSGKNLPYPDSLALMFMVAAVDTLQKKYGTALVEWGDFNRLQRIHTSGFLEKFDDSKVSLPVKGAPSPMGSLFAFQMAQSTAKKRYGTSGNSYVAVVEFGKKIKAKSIMYFGQSADPKSQHYFDQAPLYSKGEFKDVYFYKSDVLSHAEQTYHPGDK